MAKKYLVSPCDFSMFIDGEDACAFVDTLEEAKGFLADWVIDRLFVYEIDPKLIGSYTHGPVFEPANETVTKTKKGK